MIGAILSQVVDGHERVVAYASRRLSKAEKNYGISDKEGLVVIFGVKHYRPYLHGAKFTIEINHAVIRALTKSRDFTERLALILRWALILQSYDCEIIHKPGCLHRNVDALIRSKLVAPELYNCISDLLLHRATRTGPWIINWD